MKKLKFVFLSVIVLFTLNGCFKSTATMTINEDKSMKFQATYLFSKQIASLSDIDKSSFTKKGFNVTDVDSNGYVGVEVSKDYKNIDDLSNETGKEVIISDFTEENFDDSIFFKVKKGFFKNTYTANFKYDLSSKESPVGPDNGTDDSSVSESSDDLGSSNSIDEKDDANKKDDFDYSKLLELSKEMEIKFIVNLPSKNLSNNASSVDNDGKTLTWNLTSNLASSSAAGSGNATLPNNDAGSTNNLVPINYSFSMLNMGSIYLVSGIGVLLLIAIIVLVVFKIKKKKELGTNVSEPANESNIEIDPNKTLGQVINDSVNINSGVNQANSNVQPQVINPTPQVENINAQQTQVIQPNVDSAALVQQNQIVQPQANVQAGQVVNNVQPEVVQQVVSNASSDTANSQVVNPATSSNNTVTTANNVNPSVVPQPVTTVTNQEVMQNQVNEVTNVMPTQNVITPNANVVTNEVINNPVNNGNIK